MGERSKQISAQVNDFATQSCKRLFRSSTWTCHKLPLVLFGNKTTGSKAVFLIISQKPTRIQTVLSTIPIGAPIKHSKNMTKLSCAVLRGICICQWSVYTVYTQLAIVYVYGKIVLIFSIIFFYCCKERWLIETSSNNFANRQSLKFRKMN